MTEPISGPSYHPPLEPTAITNQNVPLLSQQLQSQVTLFAQQLQQVMNDPSLSSQESFLKEIAVNGNHLNQTVEQAIRLR